MLNIAAANLKKILKDYKVLIGILTAPLVIMYLFSFLGNPGRSSIEVAVWDIAATEESGAVVQRLVEDKNIDVRVLTRDEMVEKIQKKKIPGGIVFGEDGEIEILKGDEGAYPVIKKALASAIKEVELLGTESKNAAESRVQMVEHYKPNKKIYVIGFVINFMMFSMIFMINELGELKKTNVLRRNCTCPHSDIKHLGGILLSLFVVIFMQFVLVNLMGLVLFKELLFDDMIKSAMVFVPFIFLVLGIGLMISRVCKNTDVSPIIVNILVVPAGLVSGTFLPKYMVPEFLNKFSFLAPQHWVVKGIESADFMNGVLPSIIILSMMALCALTAGSYNFKKFLRN